MAVVDPDFKMSVKTAGTTAELVMAGTISEKTQLDLSGAAPHQVVIDAGGVQRINSIGVHTWLVFMEKLARARVPVTIRRLSPVLVQQAGMISSFLQGAHVESFVAPYVCPSCDHELDQLFETGAAVPPGIKCPKCSAAMELDADPNDYLVFRQG